MVAHPVAQTGFAEVQGGRLYCEVAGSGQPLLLLHAGVADSRMWDAQFNRFAQDYMVIRYDLPGFGRSQLRPGRLAPHEQVAELLQLLDVPRASVIGCSYGGRISLDFSLAYPALVNALVLVAPSVSGHPPSAALQRFGAEEDAALTRGDLDAATELNLRTWVDGPYRRPEQVDPAVRARVREMQHHAFTLPWPDGMEPQPLSPPASTRLGELRVPTLIIMGALDLPEFATLAGQLAAEIRCAEQLTIADAAHLPSMEQPEAFEAAVLAFLERQRAHRDSAGGPTEPSRDL